ncbi:MAG: BatD family protein [Candidatus Brocadiales bacterium]
MGYRLDEKMKLGNLKFKIYILQFICYLLPITYYLFMQHNCFANEINLTTWVNKKVITMEETVLFIVTVSGAQNTDQPQLPQLEGLTLAFGPSISTETRIVNNNVSFSRTFSYVLTPKALGKYTIGPVRLDYKNKTYTAEPVQIEVVSSIHKARPPQTKSGKKGHELDIAKAIFVEISTDKKEAYTYEQITLTFKLYFQRGLPMDDLQYIPPATKNFLVEKLGDQRDYKEVRNGVVYHVVELRTALFPITAGELSVPPATVKCNVLIRPKRRKDPFFSDFLGVRQRKHPVERQTEPITLTIKPLPEEGKPSDFTGAVGSYAMKVSSGSRNVMVGDPITLNIKVSGEGYIHAIGEPYLSNTEGFKVYPAESHADITERKTLIKGWKEFTKVIEPVEAGITETPTVSLSFFDPVTAQYKTVISGPIPVTVEAAEEMIPIQLTLVGEGKSKEQARVLKKDILPLMANLSALTNQGNLLYKNRILLGFLTLPLISIIASVIIQRRTERFKMDLGYARKKRAFAKAKMQLSKANHLTTQTEFYSAISKALCEYIADKLNIPPASITSQNISVRLEPYSLSSEIIGELTRCLDTCDHGRFSNEKRQKQELQEVSKSAERLIKHMEKRI